MGKRVIRLYDADVADCFDLFGDKKTAIYFEALRYRQQLKKGEFFCYRVRDITRNTSLGVKAQAEAREVLEATGWIEAWKRSDGTRPSVWHYRVTDLAYDAIKKTPRRRDISKLRRKIVNNFSLNYNKA